MDNDVFLQRGEIVPDPDKIEEHVARHGAVPFEVAAKNIANNIRAEPINNDTIQIRAIYACLLKIGVIQRKKFEPRRKLEMFFDFLHEELGAFMALEAILACLQFRGCGGNLIPVEAEAKDVKHRLMASAWDLFLLHMPETLISNEGNEHTSIFYVCTAEKAIQEIGSMRIVKRVSSIPDGPGTLPTSIGFRKDLFEQQIGAEFVDMFESAHAKKIAKSHANRGPKREHEVKCLIDDLERQVSAIVKSF